MKKKRVLSIVLIASILLSLIPVVRLITQAAGTPPDPVYNRVGTPEVAIFNAYTGNNLKFFKEQLHKHYYNAVCAGKFRKTDDNTSLLNSEVTVKNNTTYVWNGFYNSNLAYLSDTYQQLQAGYAVTRTSNSHTHRWKLIYSADLISYMNTEMYLNDEATKQFWSVAWYRGFSRSAATLRDGEVEEDDKHSKFHSLGYTINGANSRYMTISGVDQAPIRKNLYINFNNSVLYYDGQKKTCNCGGKSTGAMVSFYDKIAPTIQSVEIKNGSTPCTNFKAGDTVTVLLHCSEAIRFADDDKSGKGSVCIGLQVAGATNRLPAYLTSLDGETLTFVCTIPSTVPSTANTGIGKYFKQKLYTITGIDLTSAPDDGTALVHTAADITLKQVYGGSGNKTIEANKIGTVPSNPLGFTKTTCYVTDMAGNALDKTYLAMPFYIDCEAPYVALAGLSAETNNGYVKQVLNKTDPTAEDYLDHSDSYLGVGDSFRLTLYMNEIITGTNATVTTNVKKTDGTYLTLNVSSSGSTVAKDIGKQYGLGASQGRLTVLYTDPVEITNGMTIDGPDGIKITGVSFSGGTDASGNLAVGGEKSPDKEYHIDTAPPTIQVQPAVQSGGVNNSFYLPFMVTDAGSGVQGLPASLTLSAGNSTSLLKYAVSDSAQTPSVWTTAAMGTSIPFVQTGAMQYLHVLPISEQSYAIYQNASVSFTLSDYAGNSGTADADLLGVLLDTVAPNASVKASNRSYDDDARQGTLTVTVRAEDDGGLGSVQYQWSAVTVNDAANLTGSWTNAVGVLDEHPTGADLTASATVGSGESFRQRLWVKVTDAAGNSSVTDLGEFSYSLAGILYELDYQPAIRTAAEVKVKSLETGGTLVFDVQKANDQTHYVAIVDAANNTNVFGGSWYTAAFSGTSGYKFTNMTAAGNFLNGYTGNLSVTVYSGNAETVTRTANSVTLTTNAGIERFTLRLSPSGNSLSDVFDGTEILSADSDTLNAITGYVQSYPWTGSSSVSSTLEGVQLSINLGSDKNGWDHKDIDWENSFLALYPANAVAPNTLEGLRAHKLCAIGGGASQTVTLPAFDYTSGRWKLCLVLARRSDAASCYTSVLQNGDGDAQICLDTTAPGSLSLGVLAKRESGNDWLGGFEIPYLADTTLYIPTEGFDVFLSVEALDANGDPIDFSGESGAHINAGVMDVVAWNAAEPGTKISLSREHYYPDTDGMVGQDQEYDDYPVNGKRTLYFGTATTGVVSGFPKGILGLTTDQDNIVAIQVQYANGKSSAVTYLTVHPVSLNLSGTVETVPAVDESAFGPFSPYTTSGLITADAGTAAVTFTPDSGSQTADLTLYCLEGYAQVSGKYFMYDGTEDGRGQMTLESDGSYSFAVPTADAEAYYSAAMAYGQDYENNPHPGRYIGIFEPMEGENGAIEYNNIIKDGWQPAGYYVIYATDLYGNFKVVGMTKNAIIADGSAPIVSDEALAAEGGRFTATFTVRDDSLFSFGRDSSWTDKAISRPVELTLSFDEAYAAAIGAQGESLTLTLDAAGENYVWKADTANKLGISEVDAVLTRDGQFEGDGSISTYYHGAEDVYLTVTVKGIVSPAVTSAADLTLLCKVRDAHGNQTDARTPTVRVTGAAPQVTAMEFKPIQMTPGISDLALFVTFDQPVQPAESWIKREISGYDTVWQDAFPITNDGVWDLTFTDLFGTVYTLTVHTDDYKGDKDGVFGKYGFDLDFSTLDYVAASEGVTITASYTGTDGDSLHISKGYDTLTPIYADDLLTNRTAAATENGRYTVYLYGSDNGWTEKLCIDLNNIVSGGPEETLYFFLDEFKEAYAAGSEGQFRGTTTGPVTVSYRTSRETSPVSETTLTFRNGDNDSFSFRYYDYPTDFTYTISGKLSDYGITLAAPAEPYADTEAPAIDLVSVWTQRGSGYTQTQAFPGSASETEIANAIADSGYAQSYDFVVNASDYSKWKLVVKSAAPTSLSYASAQSDAIPGVEVQGNNVLVTKEAEADFYIAVVDNAKQDSAATADNFTCIRIPFGSYRFDTTPPVIETLTVSSGLYAKTVYLKATDTDDDGNATPDVSVSGAGLVKNTDANAAEYPWKLIFTENNTAVTVTATDAAGNLAVSNVQVSGLDVSAPALRVTWSPCFRDPNDGRLDDANPPSGPVNTDVIALIGSDKDITRVVVDGSIVLDPSNPEMTEWWSGETVITYSSRRVTVRFAEEWESAYELELFAPNGKSTKLTVRVHEGVIDKTVPLHNDLWDYLLVEELTREGYSTPYAVRLSLFDPEEDIFCTSSGTAGTAYNEDNPFVLELTESEELSFTFTDKAGNLNEITIPAVPTDYLDNTAPEIALSGLTDDASATNGSVSFTVKITDATAVALTAGDSSVTCGALTEGTDGSGNKLWTGSVSASRNGTFRLTATDSAGNASSVLFTVNNIDRTLPEISFDTTTVNVRQDSGSAQLAALLDSGVHTWDNVGVKAGSLTYDVSGVNLSAAGLYTVTYTVEDTAGNVGQATRHVRVLDKNQPVVSIDGLLTENNGILSIPTGAHTLTVSGLKTPNEPYTIKLVRGIWSEGQLKRVSGEIEVAADGSFTLNTPGFYTLYILTQSRQSYLILLHVEN